MGESADTLVNSLTGTLAVTLRLTDSVAGRVADSVVDNGVADTKSQVACCMAVATFSWDASVGMKCHERSNEVDSTHFDSKARIVEVKSILKNTFFYFFIKHLCRHHITKNSTSSCEINLKRNLLLIALQRIIPDNHNIFFVKNCFSSR